MLRLAGWMGSAMMSVSTLYLISHRVGVTVLACVLFGAYWALQASAGASIA